MTIVYVGIGSNLDQPADQVRRALQELGTIRDTRLCAQSSLYRSAPMGYATQPDFVNAVAALDTMLSPEDLLAELKALERRHSRERSFPNAPRTLDLDLLLFGNDTIRTENLVVPHPRMHERAFVLRPLLEIAPQLPFEAALQACAGQKVERIA
ncbi:MAG TPA: 2-amino-4-hydroxy-6-hydroxymethyldihydropteridine diphosphokinase [Burkholderiales bacterium]|nr:2-amino-4-hydroxy-6-hydroxymethyldihydropteridine diphosphokinase [Burkholderiales bacterium]